MQGDWTNVTLMSLPLCSHGDVIIYLIPSLPDVGHQNRSCHGTPTCKFDKQKLPSITDKEGKKMDPILAEVVIN